MPTPEEMKSTIKNIVEFGGLAIATYAGYIIFRYLMLIDKNLTEIEKEENENGGGRRLF